MLVTILGGYNERNEPPTYLLYLPIYLVGISVR